MLKQKRKTQHTHSLGSGLLQGSEAGGNTAMVSALADFGRSTDAAVRARHSQDSGNHYQNNSYKSMTGEREGTFMCENVALRGQSGAVEGCGMSAMRFLNLHLQQRNTFAPIIYL